MEVRSPLLGTRLLRIASHRPIKSALIGSPCAAFSRASFISLSRRRGGMAGYGTCATAHAGSWFSCGHPETRRPAPRKLAEGLKEAGFVEGQNVVFESRLASGKVDQLPALAAELILRRLSWIPFYVAGPPATHCEQRRRLRTIRSSSAWVRIPSRRALSRAFNGSDGDLTGFTDFNNQLMAKRIGPATPRAVLPNATVIGFLVNPTTMRPMRRTRSGGSGTAAASAGFGCCRRRRLCAGLAQSRGNWRAGVRRRPGELRRLELVALRATQHKVPDAI